MISVIPSKKQQQDILASLVVFLIALPLSLGIGLASGSPPIAAIVSAIIGGIVVGAIAGAPLVVTGPAAGLAAMILHFVQTYGFQKLLLITIIAGAIQIAFASVGLARLIQRIPKLVIEGVLSAIGFMILLGQLHIILGQKIPGSPVKNILQLPASFSAALPTSSGFTVGTYALFVGVLTIGVILAWPKVAGKFKWIPAALPAVLVATLCSLLFVIPRIQVDPLAGYVVSSLQALMQTEFWSGFVSILPAALTLAIVASAESLLTAKSIDVLSQKRGLGLSTNVDRELFAQGAGNLIAGLFGGIPMTGVMVRSAANLEAGAKSRAATIMHGVWIGVFVLFAPGILATMPLSALAAVLIVTGFRLMNIPHMISSLKENWTVGWVWPATAFAVVSTDLLKGLAIGIVLSVVASAVKRTRSKNQTSSPEASMKDAEKYDSDKAMEAPGSR